MGGLIVALVIINTTALLMCAVYKHDTGRSLPKDLFHDVFTKG